MGNKIIEGFLNSSLKKFEKYVKNFKHVASFSFLQKSKTGKLEVGYSKIPFAREEDLKEFEKVFNEILKLIATDEDKAKVKSNETTKGETKLEEFKTDKK
jgi:hypothetical protein